MIGTRTRKVLHDLTGRKGRTLLVALSVFVGVFGVVTMAALGEIISRQLERDLRPSEMAMLRVYVEPDAPGPIDNDAVLTLLRAQPEVLRLEAQAVYRFSWKRPEDLEFRTGDLYAYSEPFQDVQIEPVRLVRGQFPQPGHGEIAIELRMARRWGLDVGDTLIVAPNGGSQVERRISAIVFQPYVYLGGDDGSSSAYALLDDAQHLLHFTGFTSFYARYDRIATARQQSGDFRNTVRDRTPYRVVYYVRNDPDENPFLVGTQQFARVLRVLAIVILVVSCLLVASVINIIVAEQRVQIGTMKALGASHGDVLRIYLGLALGYGVLGTLPGIVLGLPFGRIAARAVAPIANTVLEHDTPPAIAAILGGVLGLGLPVLAALVPALGATRVTILEAITDQGLRANYGKGLLPSLVRVARLPITLVMALNSIFRQKARLALTFAALTAAGAAFMGMLIAVHTLSGVLDYVEAALGRTIAISLENVNVQELRETLFADQRIRTIEPGVAVGLLVQPDPPAPDAEPDDGQQAARPTTAYIAGIDPTEDLPKLAMIEGQPWQGDLMEVGVVLSTALSDRLGKRLGDTVILSSQSQTVALPVIGIASFPVELGFMQWHHLATLVGEIRDAPVPNQYWEPVQIALPEDGDAGPPQIWAVGIDEQVGRVLVPGYNSEQPGVILSRTVADLGGWQTGDLVEIGPRDGDGLTVLLGTNQLQALPVLAVVDIPPAQLALLSAELPEGVDRPNPAIVALDWSALAELVQFDYDAFVPQTFEIDLLNPSLYEVQREAVQPVYRNQGAFSDRVASMMLGVGGVMSLVAVLLAVVGGIGIATVMSLSVVERQREIGVIRSVGATSGAIVTQFVTEGLLIGAAAWALAVPLSYGVSRLLILLVPFSDVILYSFWWMVLPIGLAGMLGIAALATIYPALIAARKTVSEILRYK